MNDLNLLTVPIAIIVTSFPFSGGSGVYVIVGSVTAKLLLSVE